MMLHTWNQELALHPHIHALISKGGVDQEGKWNQIKNSWIFPVKGASKVFRTMFLARIQDFTRMHGIKIPKTPESWNVYCEPPYGGVSTIIKYFAIYCNRVGITDSRIRAFNHETEEVTIFYKRHKQNKSNIHEHDKPQKSSQRRDLDGKSFTLTLLEFIRRFALHILPKGIKKIRYAGVYSSNSKSKAELTKARESIPTLITDRMRGIDTRESKCSKCGGDIISYYELPKLILPQRTKDPPRVITAA
jgi:hypothetical protein